MCWRSLRLRIMCWGLWKRIFLSVFMETRNILKNLLIHYTFYYIIKHNGKESYITRNLLCIFYRWNNYTFDKEYSQYIVIPQVLYIDRYIRVVFLFIANDLSAKSRASVRQKMKFSMRKLWILCQRGWDRRHKRRCDIFCYIGRTLRIDSNENS